jgi:adenylosuccinate synthase
MVDSIFIGHGVGAMAISGLALTFPLMNLAAAFGSLVGVGYEIDGEVTTDFPTTAKLEKAKPVLKNLPGWKCDIRGIKKYEDLPENCRKYVEFIEEQIGYPITMVSNGPGRDDIIYRTK